MEELQGRLQSIADMQANQEQCHDERERDGGNGKNGSVSASASAIATRPSFATGEEWTKEKQKKYVLVSI